MKHLSGLDATFLHLETPEMPMHVGGLNVIKLPPGYQGDYYEAVKAHVASRMHLAPVFTRKLETMPFDLANPIWVDDDDIDMEYHVRRIILSKPGSMKQLETYLGRLHSSLIDRSRPLWEFYVIEGLDAQDCGGEVAFYGKLHHAAIDGQAGVALANAILDLTPVPRDVKAPTPKKRNASYQLGVAEMVGAALRNTVMQYVKLAKMLPGAAGAIKTAVKARKNKPAESKGWNMGPRTPLNVAITNQRAFGTTSLSLRAVKDLGKATGTTLNDVVMAVVAGGLRRYLQDNGGVPAKPLIAAVPFSLREAGSTVDAKDLDNQSSMMLIPLATQLADPLERLRAINAAAMSAKSTAGTFKGVIPTDFPSLGAPWILSGLSSLYGRSKLSNKIPPFANVVISNVPGPQFPLYLAGGEFVSYYPASIITHGMALNVTVQSYNGRIDFGLTACRRTLPEAREIAQSMHDAFEELALLVAKVASGEIAPPAPKPVAVAKPGLVKRARGAVASTVSAATGTVKATVKNLAARRQAKTAPVPAAAPPAAPAKPKARKAAAKPIAAKPIVAKKAVVKKPATKPAALPKKRAR